MDINRQIYINIKSVIRLVKYMKGPLNSSQNEGFNDMIMHGYFL